MDRGLTQYQVSEMLGVNRNFVCEIELNRRTNTKCIKYVCFLAIFRKL